MPRGCFVPGAKKITDRAVGENAWPCQGQPDAFSLKALLCLAFQLSDDADRNPYRHRHLATRVEPALLSEYPHQTKHTP